MADDTELETLVEFVRRVPSVYGTIGKGRFAKLDGLSSVAGMTKKPEGDWASAPVAQGDGRAVERRSCAIVPWDGAGAPQPRGVSGRARAGRYGKEGRGGAGHGHELANCRQRNGASGRRHAS